MIALARGRMLFAARPWTAIVLLHAVQAALVFWIAAHAHFCCDARYYLDGGRLLLHDGLLWADPYAGYRFYLTPLVFGTLENVLAFATGNDRAEALIPYALSAVFVALSLSASLFVWPRQGVRRWAALAVPIFLNPLVLSIVPYPLQESVVCLFSVPLLFVLLALDTREFGLSCVTGALLTACTFLARSSLIWIAFPVLVLLLVRARRAGVPRGAVLRGLLAALCLVVLMYSPQAYINLNKFRTLSPIANAEVGKEQLTFGIDMLNYGTVYSGDRFAGLDARSPYTSLPAAEKKLSFYAQHPSAGFFLAATHAWSSLHFLAFTPYVPRAAIDIWTLPLLFSSAAVATGLIGLFARRRASDDSTAFLTLTVLLSCAYCTFAATENRFGIFGFIAISVMAWQVPMNADTRTLALRASPLVLAYVCLCVMINALLMYRTGVLWPLPA